MRCLSQGLLHVHLPQLGCTAASPLPFRTPETVKADTLSPLLDTCGWEAHAWPHGKEKNPDLLSGGLPL